MNLELIGADARVHGAFETYATPGTVLARIVAVHRGLCRVFTETGELDAESAALIRGETPDMPVVGDWVSISITSPEHAVIDCILPRRTLFARRAAGRREERQTVAANVDLAFLVCGLDGDFNLRRLERYLTLVAASGADPIVVLNKADTCSDLAGFIERTAAVAGAAPIVAISAASPGGSEPLRKLIGTSQTAAFLGSSGVGKSTIVNGLLGEDRQRTAAVRENDSSGRHTTTHRELLPLPGGGALIDTPGMRELQLWAAEQDVAAAFVDVTGLASKCRFRDCAHSNDPDCAIQAALKQGSLSAERWGSFLKLSAEARRHEALANAHAAEEQERKLKQTQKAARDVSRGKKWRPNPMA